MTTVSRWAMPLSVGAVGLVLAPVLVGFAPLGGDPELLYQPIKAELGRALAAGRLPFWSDCFGLGVPLIAESHVAAFYPPNWLFYRLFHVETAYAILLWLHAVALPAVTYAYGRVLGLTREGAALAGIAFALCGFQAVHAVHEPFYCLMPYLPLCLLCADRFAAQGKVGWLAALALAWGLQVTLGHFQIQMWTAGLVMIMGSWRALESKGTARKAGRVIGLAIALAWGAALACVQLRTTWELTGVSGFTRPPQFLANYLLPPAHWAQFALPEVFLGQPLGRGDAYWGNQGTTPGEACAYVGVVPFALAFVGWFAGRDRALTPWRVLAPLSLALATMPGWWSDGFYFLLQLPGLGWFRAPARYTLITSLALCLLAGRAVNPAISRRRFVQGFTFAIVIGLIAWIWSIHWAQGAQFQAGMGVHWLPLRFICAGVAWIWAITAILAWRLGRVGAWALAAPTVLELSVLLFMGPAWWHWQFRLPHDSPVLSRLQQTPDLGLIGGRLFNLPAHSGATTAFPNLGITPPPPNYLLEPATHAAGENTNVERRWQRRFGVTHGVWGSRDFLGDLIAESEVADPVLDQILACVPGAVRSGLGPWKIARVPGTFPAVWVAPQVHLASSWGQLYIVLSQKDARDEAWFLQEEAPSQPTTPPARKSAVLSWNGRSGEVAHDGSCILVVRRTFYPGWTYQVDDGPRRPVLKVDGGLQGVPLEGSGTSWVATFYEPTGFRQARRVSLLALAAVVILFGWLQWRILLKSAPRRP